ncbi:MAG: diguanylate cyclase [Halomonas sp.]|nr:diguanylate cyclase [Halomonas sp.]TVP45743.1 MAG: diguanylate cyclase [Halomonas sp.]
MLQRTPSSLRFRFFAALGGLLIFAMVSLGALSKWLVFPALQAEERLAIKQELNRVERSITLNQQDLHTHVRDWAYWDDTYAFIQDQNPRYAEVNFSQEMFETISYQAMGFFTTAGEVYFLAGVDPISARYQTCTELADGCAWMASLVVTMQQEIANNDADQSAIYDGQHISHDGQTPFLVASSPILRTDHSGTPMGWLFKVRAMDEQWKGTIADYTGLTITLRLINNPASHGDTLSLAGNMAHAERILPLYNSPNALAVGVELNRTSYLTSLTTFRYVLFWTAGLMLLVMGLVLLLLERMVLKPLRLLTHFTQHVDMNSADPYGLTQRNDEIGVLSRAFKEQFAYQQKLNAELLKLSTHDALTELPNRRLFDQRLEEAVCHALTNDEPLSVMMLDIDHFKLFNDHYGHTEGDHCLQQVARIMQDVAKSSGFFIARTGGEEFSAILPGTTSMQAIQKCMALSDAIDHLELPHQLSPVANHITVSIGISQLTRDEDITPGTLMKSADQALYEAKAAGRHCAKVYMPPSANTAFTSYDKPS